MFSTILKEVTGYFDKRALLSAFFPSLVFWSLSVVLLVGMLYGWQPSLNKWAKLSATATALILLGFFIWVTFWSFLTLNFHPGLLSIYEGNWKNTRLEERRREYWKQRYGQADDYDSELEQQDLNLADLGQELISLRTALKNKVPTVTPAQQQAFDSFLTGLKDDLADVEALSSATLQTRLDDARAFHKEIIPTLAEAPSEQANPWKQRRETIRSLISVLDSISPTIGENRERFKRNFSLYFPPDRPDVTPTRLGNVLKTAEVRTWKKYHLDAVLIWSRLQSNLPKEFAETLQNARMSLDMMVTLSAFVLFFGTIVAAALAYGLPLSAVAISPLVLLIATPPIARMSFHLSGRTIILITIGALLLLIVLPLIGIYIMLWKGFWSPLVVIGDAALRLEFFLVLMIGLCLLSWMIYLNAVQAGVAYAEKIQSSFDLYRWKVFEGLGLQLPPSFHEERVMWQELCALLSSSKIPDARYYKYVEQTQTKKPAPPATKVKLPVLVEARPAYHVIANADLVEKDILASDVAIDAARTREELIGKRSLQPLSADQPVSRSLVTDPSNLKNTVSIGIQATQATVMGGNLKIGDLVNVVLVPAPSSTPPPPASAVFEDIRVLDVKQVTGSSQFVVVIALPSDELTRFAASKVGSKLLLARKTLS